MLELQSTTTSVASQYRQANHSDLVFAVSDLGDNKRSQRIFQCDRYLSHMHSCTTANCGFLLRIKISCREHLCSKQRLKWLTRQVGSAMDAAAELENPRLYLATWEESAADWKTLKSKCKAITASMNVRFIVQDFQPKNGLWTYSCAWIADGDLSDSLPDNFQISAFPVLDVDAIQVALEMVITNLADFSSGGPQLSEYLRATARKQFVQRLGNKGKSRRNRRELTQDDQSELDKVFEEVRSIIRGVPVNSKSSQIGVAEETKDTNRVGETRVNGYPVNTGIESGLDNVNMAATDGISAFSSEIDILGNGTLIRLNSERENSTQVSRQTQVPGQVDTSQPAPPQKGPKIRCPKCGGMSWKYLGVYSDQHDYLQKLSGFGPDRIPTNSIALTVDSSEAYRGGSPSW